MSTNNQHPPLSYKPLRIVKDLLTPPPLTINQPARPAAANPVAAEPNQIDSQAKDFADPSAISPKTAFPFESP